MKTIQLINFAMLVTILCHFVVQFVGSWRLLVVSKKIGGIIKSRSDLDQVKAAIQLNLTLGIPLICNAVMMTIVLCFSNGMMWVVGISILFIGQAVIWIVFRPIYRMFKTLPITPAQGDMADEYRSYVKQWASIQIRLKSPNPDRIDCDHAT